MRPTASVLAVLSANLACTAPAQDDTASTASDFTETVSESEVGSESDSDGGTDGGSSTTTTSDSGPTSTSTESDSDDDSDDDSETADDSATASDSASDGPLGCLDAGYCQVGEACFAGECVAIAEVPACTPPNLAPLDLPSANGQVVAFDVVDLDQNGDDEIVAWIDEVGIGVLDDQQWTKSEYLTPAFPAPTIAAIDVDDDGQLDLLLSHGDGDEPGEIAFGDGAGHFSFGPTFQGGRWLRRVELAPGRPHVFLVRSGAAYLSFEGPTPELIGLSQSARQPKPVALDAEHDGVVFDDICEAFVFRVDVDEPVHAIDMTSMSIQDQRGVGHCRWIPAALDGDAREDLVASEALRYDGDLAGHTLLAVFDNQTQPDAAPSFVPGQLARIPHEHGYGVVGGDIDGDGDDEILLAREGLEGGATLVWSDGEQPLGCAAPIDVVPQGVVRARAGDFDGDGDDEFALYMENGALRVFDGG